MDQIETPATGCDSTRSRCGSPAYHVGMSHPPIGRRSVHVMSDVGVLTPSFRYGRFDPEVGSKGFNLMLERCHRRHARCG